MLNDEPTILDEVKLLFEFVPPERLRKNITYLLTQHFIHTSPKDLPDNTQELVEDIELLLNFIDKVDTN